MVFTVDFLFTLYSFQWPLSFICLKYSQDKPIHLKPKQMPPLPFITLYHPITNIKPGFTMLTLQSKPENRCISFKSPRHLPKTKCFHKILINFTLPHPFLFTASTSYQLAHNFIFPINFLFFVADVHQFVVSFGTHTPFSVLKQGGIAPGD